MLFYLIANFCDLIFKEHTQTHIDTHEENTINMHAFVSVCVHISNI